MVTVELTQHVVQVYYLDGIIHYIYKVVIL